MRAMVHGMTWTVGHGLADRGVLITGAAGGIGSAVADAFVGAGARVCLVDVDGDELAQVGDRLGEPSSILVANIAEVAEHDELVQAASTALGNVHVLVHCAAVMRRASVTEVTEDDWDFQHSVNLKASFFLNRAVAEHMRAHGTRGRIVNFSSQAWWTGGLDGSLVYAASKGGVVSMTRGLARTYGEYGIRVNAISPGLVRTTMLSSDISETALEAIVAQTPLGYIAEPAEIASVAVFLASDHSSYITGATINVSGGFLAY